MILRRQTAFGGMRTALQTDLCPLGVRYLISAPGGRTSEHEGEETWVRHSE